MQTFIAALAGLSMASGVSAPLITNQIQDSNSIVKTSTPLKSDRIAFNSVQGLSTDQNSKTWQASFHLNLAPDEIHHISFQGGGLRAYIGWGSDHWDYGWPQRDISPDNTNHYVFRDDHSSGFAKQTAYLISNLTYNGDNFYTLKFEFFTKSYNSFTGCWGNLTIGNALVFSS